MTPILLLLRFTLSSVFFLAGYAKLRDRLATATSLVSFGVPTHLAGTLGVALGAGELAVCIGLIFPATARQSAVVALVLLALFTAVIVFRLFQGERPPCHCLGQWRSAPIGPKTIVRNVLLLLLASLIAKFGRSGWGIPLGFSQMWIGPLALVCGLLGCILLALVAWLLIRMLRQQGRILVRLDAMTLTRGVEAPLAPKLVHIDRHPLPIGAPAPSFSLPNFAGVRTALETLVASGKKLLLLFVNPDCGACTALIDDVRTWTHLSLTVALVSRGDRNHNLSKFGIGANVLLQRDAEVAVAYRVFETPSAIVVNPDGSIGSTVATGAEAIRALVEQIVVGTLPVRPAAAVFASPEAGIYHRTTQPNLDRVRERTTA